MCFEHLKASADVIFIESTIWGPVEPWNFVFWGGGGPGKYRKTVSKSVLSS